MSMLKSKEHYALMDIFEKYFKGEQLDREPKNLWEIGAIYQNGRVNELFKAFRMGYHQGKAE